MEYASYLIKAKSNSELGNKKIMTHLSIFTEYVVKTQENNYCFVWYIVTIPVNTEL